MSDLKVPSKTRVEQDDWLRKQAWVAKVLGQQIHTPQSARRSLDALGLDVPKTNNDAPLARPAHEELALAQANPEAVRAVLSKQVQGQGAALAEPPSAEVPERGAAALLIAQAQQVLAAQPFIAKDAHAAVDAVVTA